jgi:hypothetical protein
MKTAFDLSFREEIEMNNPMHSFAWVAEHFKKTNLYEAEPIKFYNTRLVSRTADHFRKYGIYTDIEPDKDPIAWREFWDREEYRRRYGITLNLKQPEGGGLSDKDLLPLWIPGKLYGCLNYAPIIRVKDDSLDTVDTKTALEQAIAQKSKSVDHFKQVEELFKELEVNVVGETATDFMDFWDGHFHYWVAQEFSNRIGLDMLVFKARRKGFSYVGAWDAYDGIDLNPFYKVFLVAFDLKYLTDDGGLFSFCKRFHDHMYKHTDWAKDTLINNESTLKLGYRHPGSDVDRGFQSSIVCYSAMNNPDCIRGKLANKIKWEELGTFPNFEETREIAYSAAESGGYKLGQSTYWGTAGSDEGDYTGLSHGFYNPDSLDCLPFNNIWDKNKAGQNSAMFFGQYQNLIYDQHGNTDFEAAEEFHRKKKQRAKDTKESASYNQWCAERCTTPQEGLNVSSSNFFSDYADNFNRKIDILNDPKYNNAIRRVGVLKEHPKTKEVYLVTNDELKEKGQKYHPPIDDTFDTLPKGYDKHGCIVEWHPPYVHQTTLEEGRIRKYVPKGLYYIVHDPYATDKNAEDISHTDSLGAAYVYEMTNTYTPSKGDRIVASWIGRPSKAEDYNHQLYLLCKYYNAKLMFENDRGQVVSDFKLYKGLSYLDDEPEIFLNASIAGKTGRTYGISIGKNYKRISAGARRFKERLGTIVGTNQITGEPILFADTINCRLLLKQLLRWNSKKGNWDCVSAWIAGEFGLGDIEYSKSPQSQEDNNPTTKMDQFLRQFNM